MRYEPFYGPDIWKPIEGAPGYQVSDLGNVRSLDRILPYGTTGTRRHMGVQFTPWVSENEWERISVHLGKNVGAKNVHELVAQAFLGPRPDGMVICHNNGDRLDNRPGNLRYDTQGNNIRDSVKHGTNVNANKRTCPRGHPLEEPNLHESQRKKGARTCKACHRAGAHMRYHKIPKSQLQEISDRYFIALWKDNT